MEEAAPEVDAELELEVEAAAEVEVDAELGVEDDADVEVEVDAELGVVLGADVPLPVVDGVEGVDGSVSDGEPSALSGVPLCAVQ